ncbi:MAG TPA: LapA family protein [Xanthobacteraceae bacterium]|nr:LapA family protein [Xanthobacteraceae bacterium]
MIRKIVSFLILVPLALVLVALSIANKQPVTVSFDPFSAGAPAFTLEAPLYVIAFVLLIAGVILGGIAAWMGQGKWRRAARHAQAELRDARNEVDILRRDLAARERAAPAPLSLRPPAA